MRVLLPDLSQSEVWGPIPYPGSVPPPNGTAVVVGFNEVTGQVIALSFLGWDAGNQYERIVAQQSALTYPGVPISTSWQTLDTAGVEYASQFNFDVNGLVINGSFSPRDFSIRIQDDITLDVVAGPVTFASLSGNSNIPVSASFLYDLTGPLSGLTQQFNLQVVSSGSSVTLFGWNFVIERGL